MKTIALCGLALCACSGFAASEETTVESFRYVCADNNVLQVVYVNGADGKGFAIIEQVDEMIPMAEQVSASGAIYKAISPNYTYTLLTKGKKATLEDDKGNVFRDCTL